MLFQLVLSKLSAEQKTVKLLWVAYLSFPEYLSVPHKKARLTQRDTQW
jgi:hypothetical protein